MIETCFLWDKARDQAEKQAQKAQLVRMANVFFPDWDGSSLRHAWFGKRKTSDTTRETTQNTQQTPKETQEALPLPKTPPEHQDTPEQPRDAQDEQKDREQTDNAEDAEREQAERDEQDEQGAQDTTNSSTQNRTNEKMRKMREAKARKAQERKTSTPTNPSEPTNDTENPKDEPQEADTPEEAAKQANGHAHHEDPTVNRIIRCLKAGIKNVWLYGPAGSGKTWAAMEAAKILNLPITILSCSAGTSASDFVGRRLPTVEPSPVSAAIGLSGIIVLDEITMLDPAIAAVANAMLANSIIQTTHGAIERKAAIIATSNTTGDGANRQYIGNNQLDAATLDRFTGGMIAVDYNTEYERQTFPRDVFLYVSHLRDVIRINSFRRIASTRSMIAATQIREIGGDWKNDIISNWTPEERAKI
jgi:predicted ATPase